MSLLNELEYENKNKTNSNEIFMVNDKVYILDGKFAGTKGMITKIINTPPACVVKLPDNNLTIFCYVGDITKNY